MRNKSLFLLVACVCGTIAAIGVSQWMQAKENGEAMVEILVASVDIDQAEEITAEKVALEQWPDSKQPPGSSSDLEAVIGKFAKTRFYAGEPVLPVKLTDSSHKVIPKGFSVVGMKARDVSIANVIQPGDRVNVLSYFAKSDLIPRSMTKTVLVGVKVYALDGDTDRKVGDDRPKNISTIELLIHKNDTEAWTYAKELGKIRLAVGNDDDYAAETAEDGGNLAGKSFVDWIEDYQQQQEEERLRQLEAKRRKPTRQVVRAPGPTQKTEEVDEPEGFEITKIERGRMIKYLIVPGKLPRIIEDTGPVEGSSVGAVTDDSPSTDSSKQSPPADGGEEDYSYLNGEDSPFYQPPGGAPTGGDF